MEMALQTTDWIANMNIGGVNISNYDTKLSPVDNYKAALLSEIITTNKSKIKLRKAFSDAVNAYGERVINGQVVLNKIDFELWIKSNINDDSMVCLGDKLIREVKRMYDQLEGNIKLLFENPAAAYDKLEDGVKDAGKWIDDEILQGLDDFFGSPIKNLQDSLDHTFGTNTIISTYLSNELGYGKKNDILFTLLKWKDRYIMTDESRKRQLILYYKSSRCLIKKCLKNNEIAKIYFYDKMVLGTYNLIVENKDKEAFDNYRKYIIEMVEMYD